MKATYSVNLLFFMMLGWGYLLCSNPVTAQTSAIPAIIPIPASINNTKGEFSLTSKTKIVVNDNSPATLKTAKYLAEQTKVLCNINLSIVTTNKSVKNSIVLNTLASGKKESYHLKVEKKNTVISGADQSGLFYGVQTLLQMINSAVENSPKILIACTDINDEPSFTWRGMHLDVSRHFFPVEFVKKMIDMLAIYKINTFHWHLTDDQGWRIEIKKYPKLTEIGGWRDATMVGHYTENDQKFDSTRYGGFYTQEQIKDVVAYAQKRYITVVPEIEMPGHAVAALSAYPQFSCTGGPFKTYTKWGVSDDVYCAGKEETFKFLEDILDEVVTLFPGQYIHIGGDECPKTRWKACPACQKRIKDEGLKNELELQSYFVKRIEKFITAKGKKLIGWDEILEGGLPERATVMSWRGYEGGVEAAHTGHDVVMTPGGYCYFDHYQSQDQANEPLAFGGFLPLEKVYSFSPVPPELSTDEAKHILGAQANVWTEYIPTDKQAEYMIFPRICAMAEILWSPKAKQDYTQFLSRLNGNLKRLQKAGINYRPLKTN